MTTKKPLSIAKRFIVRVEDGIRTHDLRNHNPLL